VQWWCLREKQKGEKMRSMIEHTGGYVPLPTPSEMGKWDRITIEEFGIHGEILMENASWQCLWALMERVEGVFSRNIAVVAGPGNNGGDGFAMARHLKNYGARVKVFHTRSLDSYRGDALYHISLTKKMGVSMEEVVGGNLSLEGYHIVVDALLGTGFSGELREDYLKMVREINRVRRDGAYVLSVDIPSGLNGLTGRPSPEAVYAHTTVTFEEAKVGLYLPEAREFVGEIFVGRIGIPSFVKEKDPPSYYGITPYILRSIPSLGDMSHKGRASHVLIIGGSHGLTGAPTLSALGALRSGAGLVTVACPWEISSLIRMRWPEIMTYPLGGVGERVWKGDFFDSLQKEFSRFDAVVLGPGMGRNKGAGDFVSRYLRGEHPPTIIDADGLFHLAQDRGLYPLVGRDTIITPHPGEMARLLSSSVQRVQADRFSSIEQACSMFSCVVVLKGAGSIIKRRDCAAYISPVACSNLSVGGSGDVLAGVMGLLRAQGMEPLQAACTGVMWHGLAGEYLKEKYPLRGNLATDIADALPEVRRLWQRER